MKTPYFLGVTSGILGMISYVILLYMDPNLLFQYLGVYSIGIASFFMLLTGILVKHQLIQHKSLTFKNLLRPIYINFIIFLVLLITFQYLVYNFVEPTLAQQFKAFYIDQQTTQMQLTDLSDRQIQQQLLAAKESNFELTIAGSIKQFVPLLIFGFLIALLATLLAQYLPTFSKKIK